MRDAIELFKAVLTGCVYPETAWTPVQHERIDPRASLLGRLQHRFLVKLAGRLESKGIAVLRRRAFDLQAREEGLDWPLIGYTMIGRRRLDNLQFCVEAVLAEGLPGDFIETGVWRGGACMLVKASSTRAGCAIARCGWRTRFAACRSRRTQRTATT